MSRTVRVSVADSPVARSEKIITVSGRESGCLVYVSEVNGVLCLEVYRADDGIIVRVPLNARVEGEGR